MKNARRLRKSKKYVQKIIKFVKSIEINSIFNQLNVIYNDIKVKLKKDFRRFLNSITLNDYFQKLIDFKNIWWNLTKKKWNTFVWKNQKTVSKNYSKSCYNNWNHYDRKYNRNYNEPFNRLIYQNNQKYFHQYASELNQYWRNQTLFFFQNFCQTEQFVITSSQKTNQKTIMFFSIKIEINNHYDDKNDRKRFEQYKNSNIESP